MYRIIRNILFLFRPEAIHHITIRFLKIMYSNKMGRMKLGWLAGKPISDPVVLGGIEFKNKVGLAAGFDKDANCYKEFAHLGFGFVEVGTVTPLAQEGNPQPRLFRLQKDKALINRMGFNNNGLDAMISKLKNRPKDLVLGGNIGVNKENASSEKAIEDYSLGFRRLFPHVDYFTVNVSSPNTKGLRDLQGRDTLLDLLRHLQNLNLSNSNPKPIFVKISPDLSLAQLDEILEIVDEVKLTGIIATNTTIDRSGLKSEAERVDAIGAGGLSGLPLKEKSRQIVSYLRKNGRKDLAIIGVGGIMTKEDAKEMIEAGADLVQIYTGFIYNGPSIVSTIADYLKN